MRGGYGIWHVRRSNSAPRVRVFPPALELSRVPGGILISR
jgi:hypothetical protein